MTKFISFRLFLIPILVLLAVPVARPQSQGGVDILLAKARSLEARGRMDLAAENWRKVLLVNPNQTEALAGLARSAKESGQTAQERDYLDRLRKINPHDPEIAAVEKLRVFTAEDRAKLDQAGRLAMQYKPDEAMKIYHEVLGDQQPPPGKWAEPFYETEVASTGGRAMAIAQLRQLCAENPNYELYRLWLASVLSYDQKTRLEALRLFQSITEPGAAEQARAPWRQALLWEKDNPDVLGPIEAYLQRYPDPELQPIADALQARQQQDVANADKERGYKALKSKDTLAAAAEFTAVLRQSPNDVNAIAGLAFVRLDQKQFAEALSLFDKARKLAPQRQDLRDGYNSASFWLAMQRGAAAQLKNPEAAVEAFQEALTLRPMDTGALLGIANALSREHRYADAGARFQQVLAQAPNNADALAGLGFVRLNQGRFADAQKLLAEARRLNPARADIDTGYRNAQFWGIMNQAADALKQNHPQAATAEYRQALLLNPNDKDALTGLANACRRSGDFPCAAKTYYQLIAAYPADGSNWMGLIQAQLGENAPEAAIATSQRIPPAMKQQLESRPEYLAQMALVFYSAHQPLMGDQALRRCMEMAATSDTEAALNLRLQIAGAFVEQGNPEHAVNIYKQLTLLHPENPSAWEGLVGAYTNEGDFSDAIAAVRSMPQHSYDAAMKNTGFLNSVAVLYSSQGRCAEAEDFLNRSLFVDRRDGRQTSQNTELQLAGVWMREHNYGNARQAYQEIVANDADSVEAWRGLMIVLHKQRDDRALVAEIPRIPPPIHTQLEADASFLELEAGAESAAGQPQDAVQLLQQARSRYTAQRRSPPADLDIELAWTMLTVSPHEPGLSELLQNAKARRDLTLKQQEAIEAIWSVWSVRRADLAFTAKPDLAFTILTDAGREYPGDRNIHAALASLYLKRHDKEKALEVFQTWGMTGAQAGDYRMAAGAAFSAHKVMLADEYLRRGLKHFPNDAELIHMNAQQDILRGDYQQGERELESALAAMHQQNASEFAPSAGPPQNLQENADDLSASAASALAAHDASGQVPSSTPSQPLSSSQSAPPCQPETARGNTANFRFKPISLVLSLSHGRRIFAVQQGSVQSETPAPPQSEPPQSQSPAQPQSEPSQTQPQTQSQQQQPKEQQQIQDEIDAVNNRNTPLIGAESEDTGRAGDAGIDRLIVSDNLLGSAVTASNQVRFAVEAHGVYASSGTPNGTSNQLYGTVPAGALFGNQYQIGYSGNAQLSTNTFGLLVGTTPQSFPIHNLTAGIRFRPLNGWFTFTGVRDSVKDSLLSYAGARDPGTGIRWGGVVANTGTIQLNSAPSNNPLIYKTIGEYASASYSFLQGTKVPDNWSALGSAGLYWNIVPGLTVGVNGSAMHYNKNLNFYSFGQGGYFSPQQYYLGSIPISWYARHPRFEYQIKFSGGVQYLHQDASPFYPVLPGTVALTQGMYASNTSTVPNYDADLRLGYRASRHVYLDIFATANNASNYYQQSVGFSLKFMIDPIPTSTDLKVNSIPDWTGKQPFSVR